jgi:hypothetical protein
MSNNGNNNYYYYEEVTCMLLDVEMPGDMNVIQKEAKKILKLRTLQ